MATLMTGIAVLMLAVISPIALYKFFEWLTPNLPSGRGDMGGFTQAAMAGGLSRMAENLGSQSRDPGGEQESFMDANGPGGGDDGPAFETSPPGTGEGFGSDGSSEGTASSASDTSSPGAESESATSDSELGAGTASGEPLPTGATGSGIESAASEAGAGASGVSAGAAGAGAGMPAVAAAEAGSQAIESTGDELGGDTPSGARP